MYTEKVGLFFLVCLTVLSFCGFTCIPYHLPKKADTKREHVSLVRSFFLMRVGVLQAKHPASGSALVCYNVDVAMNRGLLVRRLLHKSLSISIPYFGRFLTFSSRESSQTVCFLISNY